jgi:hypothetical protein
MKTNSSSKGNPSHKENIILGKLKTKTINKIARANKYLKRNTGKISPKNLIIGFMIMASKHRNTYSDWATEIGILEKTTISKQSLCERMHLDTENFIRTVVEKQLCEKVQRAQIAKVKGATKLFKNVMIDDSTVIHLPDELAEYYPGNVSRGKKKSQAKIHALYNLTENSFPFFHIHSYCNNDRGLSSNVLPYLQKGDLCIRDLGFTVLDVINEFFKKGVNFISRKLYCAKVYEIESGTEIDLLKELKKKKFIDREVLIGMKHQIKVRLIAIPIPVEQAAERRRKALRDRDRRLNHSAEYYQLLGFSIFITNITSKKCDSGKIAELYKLRWRIEIIFKSWKSCFSLEKLIHRQCKNIYRVNCIIYLMLLYIFLFHVIWWNNCAIYIEKGNKIVLLSILKLANFFRQHFTEIISSNFQKKIIELIKINCAYDKRKDRENAKQLQFKLAA